MSLFSVSIVTYRSNLDQLRETLISLSSEIEQLTNHRADKIYIIDNNSGTDYLNSLRNLLTDLTTAFSHDTIELLPQTKNHGFGNSHNIAIQKCTSDYFLILNPDVCFLPGSLGSALEALQHDQDIGLCLPVVLNDNLSLQKIHSYKPSFFDIYLRSIAPAFLKRAFKNHLCELTNVPIDEKIPTGSKIVFSGCCMFFKLDILKKLEGFDERYFLYFEDYDLSLRSLEITASFINSAFKIKHFGGNSFSKSKRHLYFFIRSALTFYLFTSNNKNTY